MWLHPWLGIFVILCVVAIVGVMLVSGDAGRTQVWTSLVAVAVLAVFWPLVRRNLRRRGAAVTADDASAPST